MPPHKVIDVFDRLAAQYDTVLPFFTAMAERIVAAVPIAAGRKVLDLGAGAGAVTGLALARGARVSAVDAAPAMVARLRADHPRAESAVMDAHHLDFPDGTFDVVVASFVMHLLDDPDAAAREVRRVLAPGGVFALTLPGPPPGWPRPAAHDLWAEYGRYLLPGGDIGRPLDAGALLAGAGFGGIEAGPAEVDLAVPGGGQTLWRWNLSHGTIVFIEHLPPGRREEFRWRVVASEAGAGRVHAVASLWTARAPETR
jgi:SAM-dependent methyltransferase